MKNVNKMILYKIHLKIAKNNVNVGQTQIASEGFAQQQSKGEKTCNWYQRDKPCAAAERIQGEFDRQPSQKTRSQRRNEAQPVGGAVGDEEATEV